jgi:Xaa-Pro aminopeptidase
MLLTGKSSKVKIDELRKHLIEKKAEAMVITMLDEVAWLFNLRGSDIPYNPGEMFRPPYSLQCLDTIIVFFAYALVTHSEVVLYIDETQVDESVSSHLASGIVVKPYYTVFEDLTSFSQTVSGKESVS